MNYKVFYITRWFKDKRFLGRFDSLYKAIAFVDFMQNKSSNGKKIRFKIIGSSEKLRS